DLVGVHVARRARAGLEDVDREVVVVRTLRDLGGRLLDCVGDVNVEYAELGIDGRRGALDGRERSDQRTFDPRPGDGEVLDGALRLRAPLRPGGYPDLTHRVALDPVLFLVAVHDTEPTSSPGTGDTSPRVRSG